jgi:hypothetical protein
MPFSRSKVPDRQTIRVFGGIDGTAAFSRFRRRRAYLAAGQLGFTMKKPSQKSLA